ncbi:hypothetical protein [Mycolicibacterium bacteremicum]|uniref:hypothetical protein n=1 Tax=Mycolicibacterium bacteremicum TaxID=564198 RepID=UPI0009F2A5D3|nr:hypothetical protein [Mycolicibacterium bacteremicum]MCV7435072.1 hypothetical protein [Mycolicibacterium bacteremicum]
MTRTPPLAWLYRLDRHQQAELLAKPHAYLPATVAHRITGQTNLDPRDCTARPPRRQLRPEQANLLEEERLRLDDWWSALPAATRADLLRTRHTAVPERHRSAVLAMTPGEHHASRTDAANPHRVSGIVAAYLEMVHHHRRPADGTAAASP